MKGAEILLEMADDLRRRLARLESIGYIDHEFYESLMPKVLEIHTAIGVYCATEETTSSNGVGSEQSN